MVTPHDKNVFLSYDAGAALDGSDAGRGIERLLDYCGEETLHQRNVMWLPCDIPLVARRTWTRSWRRAISRAWTA